MNKQQFVKELGKLRPSSTFLSVLGYRNEAFEIADYNIIFHMSYANTVTRSIAVLQDIVPANDDEKKAKAELLSSFHNSLTKALSMSVEETDPAYTYLLDSDGNIIKGIKLHPKTDTLHLFGLIVNKRILMPGSYEPDTRKPFTIVKDNLRRRCPISKFRQFRMKADQVDSISVQNLSLLPPE